jgi:TPR repeat protein
MKEAAENEQIDAQYALSDMYYNGIGVEQDSMLGDYWWETAEENDYWYYYYGW